MKSFFKFGLFLICCVACNSFAGTLIYKVHQEKEKIISDITIMSIDKKQVVLKVGNGIERIPLSSLVKYYNTDIKIGSVFDDGSQEYDIQVRNWKKPASRTGYSGSKKNRVVSELEFEYDIRLKQDSAKTQTNKRIKRPYFYLYVLTVDDYDNRKIFHYFSPDAAKCNFKSYDEALMMEKVYSSERESFFLDYGQWKTTSRLNWQKQKFVLDGIKERKIIATYLVVWGKDSIIYEGGEIWDPSYAIHPEWYTHPKQNQLKII